MSSSRDDVAYERSEDNQKILAAFDRERARTMFDGFMTAIREAVKLEKAYERDLASRNAQFSNMMFVLKGHQAQDLKSKMEVN